MSSPWARIAVPEAVNLRDIMSEEVARDLQAKEDRRCVEETLTDHVHDAEQQQPHPEQHEENDELCEIPPEVLEEMITDGTDTDEMIAMMLQRQFDKEYDDMLKKTEEKYNGTSKVSLSFENYRRTPQTLDFESDSEEEEIVDLIDRKTWDRFDDVDKTLKAMPACGYLMKEGKMITKHDIALNGNKNSAKLMSQFPPEFQTGDGASFDFKLSNSVLNGLRLHSRQEETRRKRLRDKKEDQATSEFGLDEATRLIIMRMINKGLLENVNGIISIGKEAVILHANCDQTFEEMPLPEQCVIKVYKTTLAEFKQREKYIRDDHRFKDRLGKQNIRKTIHLWAEKEMANLMRLKKVGINCPDVIRLRKHVLVMSFIGARNHPAPKLKDADLDEREYQSAYEQVARGMRVLYREAKLIHADLSEYNILWHNQKCYFIDVSQSLQPMHKDAFHFLRRDCENVINFFLRKGTRDLPTAGGLFHEITGCDFTDKIALETLRNSFKIKPHLVDKPGMEPHDGFNAAWQKVQASKTTINPFVVHPRPIKAVHPPIKAEA